MGTLETEVTRLQAEIDRLRRALTDVCGQIVCGQLTGKLPDNFLEQFSQLPDRPLEHVLRFLPARQVPQMRHVSRRFNHLIRKCSKTMPKKGSKGIGSVLFKANHAGELTVEWFDPNGIKIKEATCAGEEVALSELLRFMRVDHLIYFGEGLSAADEVLDQLSKAWLTICPLVVIFAGDFSKTSRNSLRAFLGKVEPFVKQLSFQDASNIGRSLLSDDLLNAAGRLDGLMIKPLCSDSDLCDINIGDDTLLAMANSDDMFFHFFVQGCSGITPGGIRAFIEKWLKKEMYKCELLFYKCSNVTPAAVEKECGDLLKKEMTARVNSGEMSNRVKYTIECHSSDRRLEIFFDIDSFRLHFVKEPRPGVSIDDLFEDDDDLDSEMDDDDDSMEALEAEVARVHAENDRLRRTLADFNERIACGRLTGELPDNFLEQFNQLPDRPLEQVLRFLPPGQVAQMRLVSRKFNQLIRKCSKTMPKKEQNGSVLFKINDAGQLTVELFDDRGSKITETMLTGNKVALSELLRLIRIDGLMFFGKGLSATSEVLDQLSKAWLAICPEVVVFAGDLCQTSRDSLRAFLVKVEPFIGRLHFQGASNIAKSLLDDDLIGAAGQLDGLMVQPYYCGWRSRSINIGDETLLAMADADDMPSYFLFMGCSGITPGGTRAFIEKWMNKWMKTGKPEASAEFTVDILRSDWDLLELIFYNCVNVTPAAVEEACGDLLKKETTAVLFGSGMVDRVLYSIQCRSSNRRLEIFFHINPFRSHLVNEPRPGVALDLLVDDEWDSDMDHDYEDVDDDDDDDDFEADYLNGHDLIMPNGQWA
uniref:F-box domain-containing protein n=1 Tax=Plectus sambesii TaxID=2011161 RepID=A0A914VN67_9BILA